MSVLEELAKGLGQLIHASDPPLHSAGGRCEFHRCGSAHHRDSQDTPWEGRRLLFHWFRMYEPFQVLATPPPAPALGASAEAVASVAGWLGGRLGGSIIITYK